MSTAANLETARSQHGLNSESVCGNAGYELGGLGDAGLPAEYQLACTRGVERCLQVLSRARGAVLVLYLAAARPAYVTCGHHG